MGQIVQMAHYHNFVTWPPAFGNVQRPRPQTQVHNTVRDDDNYMGTRNRRHSLADSDWQIISLIVV